MLTTAALRTFDPIGLNTPDQYASQARLVGSTTIDFRASSESALEMSGPPESISTPKTIANRNKPPLRRCEKRSCVDLFIKLKWYLGRAIPVAFEQSFVIGITKRQKFVIFTSDLEYAAANFAIARFPTLIGVSGSVFNRVVAEQARLRRPAVANVLIRREAAECF